MTNKITSPIPTNIITGFLGSGKTTLIQHLLRQRPEQERWAILVNEFGEIGVDGQLLQSGPDGEPAVFIREVPGGCMCCTSGLPMQIALNQLLTRANPQRLLIEPTGLGHPKEVLAELKEEHNRDYIDVKSVITLIDARKLVQPKYHTHQIYKEQLQVADLLVANKSDLYEPADISNMKALLAKLELDDTPLELTTQGTVDSKWLDNPAETFADLPPLDTHHHHGHKHHSHKSETARWKTQLQEQGYACTKNSKDDFYTEGWIYNNGYIFDFDVIYEFLETVNAERIKGIFITDKGIFGFNKVDSVLDYAELDESDDTRVEFIFNQLDIKNSEQTRDIETTLIKAIKTRLA